MSEEEHQTQESAATPEAAGKTTAGRRRTRQKGEKRELEQAPLLLRKASKILLVGALAPFFVAIKYPGAIDWGVLYGAKALALLGCWIFHQGYMATHGGKASVDVFDKLAKAHHAVLPSLAAVFWIAALAYVIMSGGAMALGASGEILTLVLAGATFSHIFGYEHGGRFNPLFPLMFLGPGIAGLLNVFGAVGLFSSDPGLAVLGLLGSLVVAAGGCLAIYTMYASMKQAKVEGDIKRQAQREERKRQRDAQREQRAQALAEEEGGDGGGDNGGDGAGESQEHEQPSAHEKESEEGIQS